MIRRILLSLHVMLFISMAGGSQEAIKYMLPPDEIVRIVDAPVTPSVLVSPDKQTILVAERQGLPTIRDLAVEEYRLAGLRIDPSVNGPSRSTYFTAFRIMKIDGSEERAMKGLPDNPKLGSPVWSDDGQKVAFTNSTAATTELWVCDLKTMTSKKIAENLNGVFGYITEWLPDGSGIIFSVTDPARGPMPVKNNVPEGPVVQENLGSKAQAATYQDLLKDPYDEALFEYLAASALMI
ncbi:MAG: S9 family peptidase, partial [Bacteroidales bacterium]|nr:S9 family peptidase [Bacteroidales bacterium]